MKLEELQANAIVKGVVQDQLVTVIGVIWHGSAAIELTYKTADGRPAAIVLYRTDEERLSLAQEGLPWSFDSNGSKFRLVAEANRIHLAYLFDPVLAVHTSQVEPLPHQITAVYEEMLTRQPLRFLLADDPGAGKTIMAGLLIRELIVRGDLQRCLIVCPGSLAEQWQDELHRRFQLKFDIATNDQLEAAHTGNWFIEHNLVIARLDKLSRNTDLQEKLKAPDAFWDLVVCDEAHKLSATQFGDEVKYTKRYQLGQLLSRVTRHYLLMTATPHNGKDIDFQLFMALLDGDRFEGRHRDGAHTVDASDMIRRMVKEDLLRFDATPLFPERRAYTVPYKLTDGEAALYKEVTEYVKEEYNRAEKLQNKSRTGTIGFALTILQRRLASSPEAILTSLINRREKLERKLRETQLLHRGGQAAERQVVSNQTLADDDIDELDDVTETEMDQVENEVLYQATAANTIAELKIEIETLKKLEGMAAAVRRSGEDRKWSELSTLLNDIFTPNGFAAQVGEGRASYGNEIKPVFAPTQKLVIFTEHRDTLRYLHERISTHTGRADAIVEIHGSMGREARMAAQEAFRHDPNVRILLATDAAGEGINLQRAHLMVNYDLPWNPNRLEQRFGRIHRIGQTEVCHLWNLVADETREGEVYRALFEKLEEARSALGGRVYDVLGDMVFDGKPLRDLLLEAIRYGERPEVRMRLSQAVANALDRGRLQSLLNNRAIAHDVMNAERVFNIRREMERAEARRLQPHYIESFFLEALSVLGGSCRRRESRRYEVTHVPAVIRERDRQIGFGEPVLSKYERIAFDKSMVAAQPPAAFIYPGHPLLNSMLDLILEQNRSLLKQGTVLVDDADYGTEPRVLFILQHDVQDGSTTRSGDMRTISRRMVFVEIQRDGATRHLSYAPYLDYRPLAESEPTALEIASSPLCQWINRNMERTALTHCIEHLVPAHLSEVRERRLGLLEKTEAAVKERLTREITYWDHRAEVLRNEEYSGRSNAHLNSGEARKRADQLQERMKQRLAAIQQEKQLTARSPQVIGGLLVVPAGLVAQLMGTPAPTGMPVETAESARRAREIVMKVERELGFEPEDRETDRLGYDLESSIPGTGRLRFIEVKGRDASAETITVTCNEVLTALNKPDDYILAIVLFYGDKHTVHYVRRPFTRQPDFGVTTMEYRLNGAEGLLPRATVPC